MCMPNSTKINPIFSLTCLFVFSLEQSYSLHLLPWHPSTFWYYPTMSHLLPYYPLSPCCSQLCSCMLSSTLPFLAIFNGLTSNCYLSYSSCMQTCNNCSVHQASRLPHTNEHTSTSTHKTRNSQSQLPSHTPLFHIVTFGVITLLGNLLSILKHQSIAVTTLLQVYISYSLQPIDCLFSILFFFFFVFSFLKFIWKRCFLHMVQIDR